MTRKEEREQAFILLFEKSFHPDSDLDSLYDLALEDAVIGESDFAKQLFFRTWEAHEAIDACIERSSRNWKISRISKVALAVLRLAVCEILYFDEIPEKVSVNEAVELSKKYGASDDSSFVNGVLGAVLRSRDE
ncbi:MAG: transcription antitermination factor NusB [Clostridia bacterium]|nr:transcription antitermination factor NusB [Clostridia bacterium]